ncbi:DUF4260 domain-containing protein [Virgibacillus siamensis]|uniref:DUF4260 domain-containing protein n=1 Tax=Virgibacillus siamensis TaxID=480071 RepID=UPI001FE5ADEB|nr:DUF4260 domain-containing protein [Virgibacillus siamensis]
MLASVYFYFSSGLDWLLFAVLLFAPDISMFGYVHGKKAGAIVYNLFHTYVIPIMLLLAGMLLLHTTFVAVGLIWTAHIGMDRMLGFGLKYPDDFKDTHLTRV